MSHSGSQNNKSFIFSSVDNETYFTYYSEFNRPWQDAVYLEIFVLVLLFLWSVFGNVLFIAYLIKFERSRTVINYLVCNLALADVLYILISPFMGAVRISESWRLGVGACRFANVGTLICASVMIWTMAAISIERYLCIVKTSHSKSMKHFHAIVISIVIWSVTCVVMGPIAIFYHVKTLQMGLTTVEICTLVWPHGTVGLIMPCVSLVVLFVIPVTLISVNYYKILRKYLSAKTAVMQATNQMRNVNVSNSRRKRDLKILKTLVTLVVLFVVMWTPVFMVLGFIIVDKNTDRREISSSSLFWTLTLTYANSGVNPFLYGFTSNTLKQYAMCCCRRNKVSVAEMTFVSNTAVHHRTQQIAVSRLSS